MTIDHPFIYNTSTKWRQAKNKMRKAERWILQILSRKPREILIDLKKKDKKIRLLNKANILEDIWSYFFIYCYLNGRKQKWCQTKKKLTLIYVGNHFWVSVPTSKQPFVCLSASIFILCMFLLHCVPTDCFLRWLQQELWTLISVTAFCRKKEKKRFSFEKE